jgi:hypothetical protein
MAKLINLVALIGATVWLSRAPDWEPAIAFAVSFLTLVGLDRREARAKKKGVPKEQLDHDRQLFRRYDEIMTEQGLRDELNGNLYNARTRRPFLTPLHTLLDLSLLQEGRYFDAEVQTAFKSFTDKANELNEFTAVHFFHPHGGVTDGSTYMLYPDLKHGTNDQRERWEEHLISLRALLDDVEETYLAYRQAVKQQLTL